MFVKNNFFMKRIGIFGDCTVVQKEFEILSKSNEIIISGFFFNENNNNIASNITKFENFNELLENSDIIEFLTPSKDIFKYISKTIKNVKNLILAPEILRSKDLRKFLMLSEEAEIKFYIKKNANFIDMIKNKIKNFDNLNCLNIKYYNYNVYHINQIFLMIFDVMNIITSLDNIKINKMNIYKFSTYSYNDSIYVNLLTSKSNIINFTIISQFSKNLLIAEVYEQEMIYEINFTENTKTDYKREDILTIIKKFNNNQELFDPEKEIYPLILTHQIIEN